MEPGSGANGDTSSPTSFEDCARSGDISEILQLSPKAIREAVARARER